MSEYLKAIETQHFVYYLVPKVANTSIKLALHHWYDIPYRTIDGFGPDVHNLRSLKYVPLDIQTTKHKIGFVRDPWSRLVSAYRNKVNPHFQPGVVRKHGFTENTTFEQFVDYVLANPLSNHHWIPCSKWFEYADEVVRFEEIPQWWSSEIEQLGAPPLPACNSSGKYFWRDYYTEETYDKVLQGYKDDAKYY